MAVLYVYYWTILKNNLQPNIRLSIPQFMCLTIHFKDRTETQFLLSSNFNVLLPTSLKTDVVNIILNCNTR